MKRNVRLKEVLDFCSANTRKANKIKKRLSKLHRLRNSDDYIKLLQSLAKQRGYGFIPLNDPFIGSHGHHIDNEYVIFIPKELHKAYPHAQSRPITMKKINELAYQWLAGEWGLRLKNETETCKKWYER